MDILRETNGCHMDSGILDFQALNEASVRFADGVAWKQIDATRFLVLTEDQASIHRGQVFISILGAVCGTTSVVDLVDKVSATHEQSHVYYALEQLCRKGVLQVLRSDYHDHAETDVVDRQFKVLSYGLQNEILDITDNFRGAALIIAAVDYLDPNIEEFLRNYSPNGTACIIKPVGRRLFIGPMLDAENMYRTWSMLRRRLLENRSLTLGFAFNPETLVAPVPAFNRSRAKFAFSLMEALLVSEEGRQKLGRSIAVFDTAVGELQFHSFLPIETWDGTTSPLARDGGVRQRSAEETYESIKSLVSPISGLVRNFRRENTPPNIHVFNAECVLPLLGSTSRKFVSRTGSAGKGATEAQAKVSCIAEAVERYSCGYRGDETTIFEDAAASSPIRKILPGELLLFSEKQFSCRDQPEFGGPNWVPQRYDRRRAIAWSKAKSLTFGTDCLIPTAFCYFNVPDHLGGSYCRADSNGCAAGNTTIEATLQGILELVERDSCAIWWYNRIRRPHVTIPKPIETFFEIVRGYHESKGRTVALIDITNDLGIPTVVATSWLKRSGGEVLIGLGTHLSLEIAISRALSELNQMVSVLEGPISPDDFVIQDWMRNHTVETDPYLQPLDQRPIGSANFSPNEETLEKLVACAVKSLGSAGIETLVVNCARNDVGMPVVRVVAPGLRHFWPRFGPGRLFDVPVAAGWQASPTSEFDLNPIPFFL